jgi:hypothetical protein
MDRLLKTVSAPEIIMQVPSVSLSSGGLDGVSQVHRNLY